jgi:hypothetical protein
MVLADSHRLPLAPWYLGYFQESIHFHLRDYHPLWCSFPEASVNKLISYSSDYRWFVQKVPQHLSHKGQRLERVSKFRLFPFRSPLLRKSLLFSLPGVTEMFHFSPFALHHLWIQWRVLRHDSQWVAPFGNRRVRGCFRLADAYRR